MKAWFTRFRISRALDAKKPLSRSLQRRIESSEELRCYAADHAALDEALRRTAPKPAPALAETDHDNAAVGNPPPPTMLHRSIMAAIRTAQPTRISRPAWAGWQWLAPAGIAAMVVLGVVWLPHRHVSPRQRESVAPLATAFEGGNELAQAIPTDLTAPLSDELTRLNTDLDRTGQFLLANLP